MRAQPVLENGRRDVLAGRGDEQLLLAAGDRQVAGVVELADVTAVEPAVVVDGLGRRIRVVVVAAEDDAALDQHLAVVGDLDGGAWHGSTDAADADRVRPVQRAARGGLGQSVALEDRHADAAEEVPEPGAQRRAAGDRVLHPAAEQLAKLAVDQPVEQPVLEPQGEPGAALVLGLAVGDRDVGGAVEDLALAVRLRLGRGGVVDLLEDARHGQHERRLEDREVGQQVLDVGGMPHPDAGGDGADLNHPAEDVRQRQEQQGRPGTGEQVSHAADHVVRLDQEVAVGQLAALGPAGRAGRVDDRGQAVGGQCRPPGVDLGVVDAGPGFGQLRDCVARR